MNVEEKMTKKEKIMIIVLVLLLLLFSFIIIVVLANKDNDIVTVEPLDINDVDRYVRIEQLESDNYLSVYKDVNIKKINFMNLQEVLVSNFNNKQTEIIDTLDNNIVINKDNIDKYNTDNKIENYQVNSKIETTALAYVKDNVLSVLYLVEDTVDYKGLTNYITNIFIDVSNNSIVSTDMILSKYNLDKNEISKDIYNKVFNDHNEKFIDKDTKNELTKVDIQQKEQDYIKVLTDNFDEYIYLYFYDNNIYLKYNKNAISNKLFNEDLENINYSTLKVNIVDEVK